MNMRTTPQASARPAEAGDSLEFTLERRVIAKVRRRLIPLIFTLYIVAYLDRINVGFAALRMNHELDLDPAVFGFGAGIFFLGYFIFEVPSNLILERVGARLWIARIMISWGAIAAAMAFIRGATSFYLLRFLLGAAEAGFFPGMILYLTYWFPARQRASALALFMTATAFAGVIGAPISGVLLEMHGMLGLSGWQWLFLIEGAPAMLLGVAVPFYLDDRPADALWLEADERHWLVATLIEDREQSEGRTRERLHLAFTSPRVWLLSLIYFLIVAGNYGIGIWIAQIVKERLGAGSVETGFLSVFPFLFSALAMVGVGKSSDYMGERRWHVAASAFAGATGLLISAHTSSFAATLGALSLGAAGISGCLGPFWSLPPIFLAGSAAAAGIALINSIGNLGGFFGPYLMGLTKELTGDFNSGFALLGIALAAGGALALMLRTD